MNGDWAEYCRLLNAGVSQPTAATVVLEQQRRRAPNALAREHGSERGYQQHRWAQTNACPACLAAHAGHDRLFAPTPTRTA